MSAFLAATSLFSFTACDNADSEVHSWTPPPPSRTPPPPSWTPPGHEPNYPRSDNDPRRFIDAQDGLCDAVSKQNENDVVYFLKRMSSPNRVCDDYFYESNRSLKPTPVGLAIGNENILILRHLLKNGADAQALHNTHSLLSLAIDANKAMELVALLLQHGVNPNNLIKINGQATLPVNFALFSKKIDVYQLLLRHGARPSYEFEEKEKLSTCIETFIGKSSTLYSDHKMLRSELEESRGCPYAVLIAIISAKADRLTIAGCHLGASLKKRFEAFSKDFHEQMRGKGTKQDFVKCMQQPGAEEEKCKKASYQFNMCLQLGRFGKDLEMTMKPVAERVEPEVEFDVDEDEADQNQSNVQ